MVKQERFNPFPGLRPYTGEENHLFFGREEHVDELVTRLKAHRFVAVLGTSGSGKSSLVFAGLFPRLEGGVKTRTGTQWGITSMRPGRDPIMNLAGTLRALDTSQEPASEAEKQLDLDITAASLRRSHLGLIRVINELGICRDQNLLILVDQFEELFRVESGDPDERRKSLILFVRLLLEVTGQTDLPVYVLITMRSDFLAECVRIPGLAEAINEGQYLIPRLTRRQRREVITGPVQVGGATISNPLLQQLLNDVGDSPDQLPILQHVLRRTYDLWLRESESSEPIGLSDYQKTGGMEKALSFHAEEAFAELEPAKQKIAEILFKCLTFREADGRGVRRPCTVEDICKAASATEKTVIEVIECFRQPDRAFLTPSFPAVINKSSLIDISHESLMRIWKRLAAWVDEEAEAVDYFRRLSRAAELYFSNQAGLWRDPELELALQWVEINRPTTSWTARYQLPLDRTIEFLELSRAERETERTRQEEARRSELERAQKMVELEQANARILSQTAKRQRKWILAIASALLVAIITTLWSVFSLREARRNWLARARAEIVALSDSSLNLYRSDRKFEALLKGMEAADQLKKLQRDGIFDGALQKMVETSLIQSLGGVKERNRWIGHRAWPNVIAYSPSGEIILSAGFENLIKRFRSDGTSLTSLKGHSATIFALAINGEERIVSGDEKGNVILWDQDGSRQKTVKTHGGTAVRCLCFNRQGSRYISGGDDGILNLWDRQGNHIVSLRGSGEPLTSLCFSPDGNMIIAGDSRGYITQWQRVIDLSDHAIQKATWQITHSSPTHMGAVTSICYSPNNRFFVSAAVDKSVKLQYRDGRLLDLFEGEDSVNVVRFSPSGDYIAAACANGQLLLWRTDVDIPELTRYIRLNAHNEPATGLDFSPDGKFIVSTGQDFTVRVWQLENDFQSTLVGHSEPVMGVDVSPDGQTIASGGIDRTVKLWHVNGTLLRTFTGSQKMVRAVRFGPRNRILAWASHDGTVSLLPLDGTTPPVIYGPEEAGINDLDFTPDGSRLITAGLIGNIRIREVPGGRLLRDYFVKEREGATWGVRFGPEGEFISTSADGKARIRSLVDEAYLVELQGGGTGVVRGAFSPGGEYIATASMGDTRLWTRQGRLLYVLNGHNNGTNGVSFSPDGSFLATAGRDGAIKLWKTNTGILYRTLLGHSSSLNQIVFSPDGTFLVSGSADKTVKIWYKLYLTFDELVAHGEAWLRDYRALNRHKK